MIRPANSQDADAIVKIYNHYIANTLITFEEHEIDAATMVQRINQVEELKLPWVVVEDPQGHILGYAYASQWKSRSAYRFAVEVSVYLAPESYAQGLGSSLYAALFERLKLSSTHTVLAVIALPNPASVALSEKFSMKKVAHFEQVGRKFDQWVDVGFWQCLLDSSSD